MKIHEYQGKQLLAAAGVTVPRGIVARTPDEAAAAFTELGGEIAVMKSQIHAGGRGKGRFKEQPDQPGVVLIRSADEARANAERMLGNTLVTIQTGEAGKTVNVLFVEQGLNIARELYLGIVVDRESGGPVVIASSEGGMESKKLRLKHLRRFSGKRLILVLVYCQARFKACPINLGWKGKQHVVRKSSCQSSVSSLLRMTAVWLKSIHWL